MKLARSLRAVGRVRRVWRPALVFEIWSTLLFVALLAPATGWILNRLVASSGQFAVSDHDLVTFFASPRGVVFALLSAGFVVMFLLAERAGLLVIIARSERGEPVTVSAVLWEQLFRLPALMRLALLQVAGLLALAVPFLFGVWLTYRFVLGEWDFYFYLNVRPQSWWIAVSIVGGLGAVYAALALCLHARWMLAVPTLIFEGAPPTTALKRSWRRTRGRVAELLVPLAVWWGAVVLAAAATSLVLRLAATAVLDRAGITLSIVVPVVLITLAINMVADLLWFMIAKIGHVMLAASFTAGWVERPAPPPLPPARPAPRGVRTAGWLVVAGLLGSGLFSGAAFLERLQVDPVIATTGHRGSKSRAPENTLSAVRHAIAEGADYAEIDVQTTADGVVVLLHDADFMRVASVNRRLGDVTAAELADIDVGSWFAPEFAGERVPTLREVIDVARGRIRLNIELKLARPDPTLVERTVAVVRETGFEGECVMSSLSIAALTEVEAIAPEISTGLILFQSVGDPSRTDVDFLSLSAGRVTSGLVQAVHRRGGAVHVWTVNDVENVLAMIGMGVDNIITDHPERVRGWIEAWRDLSAGERVALMLRNLIVDIDRPETGDL
jgi:glycerophosphoryl diester phosphodiesterase